MIVTSPSPRSKPSSRAPPSPPSTSAVHSSSTAMRRSSTSSTSKPAVVATPLATRRATRTRRVSAGRTSSMRPSLSLRSGSTSHPSLEGHVRAPTLPPKWLLSHTERGPEHVWAPRLVGTSSTSASMKGTRMGSNIDDAKGRLKEATGDVTGDDDLQREGKADQAGAKVKDAAEGVKDKVGDAVDSVKDKITDR